MIQSLNLTNFRSYRKAEFELSPEVTLIVGPNASGKTNLLEGLYVLAVTKSFRAPDRDLVTHQADFYRLEGQAGSTRYSLTYSETKGEKTANHNQAKKSLATHLGTMPVILFEPNDLAIVIGPPDRRRRYLDYILCQTDPSYLQTQANYRRVLRQRNSLLEGFSLGQIQEQIFAWDIKLTQLAAEIFDRRQALIKYINQQADRLYAEVAGETPGLRLAYLPSVAIFTGSNPVKKYADAFMEALVQNLTRDLAAGFTTIGPHREDFQIEFKSRGMNAVASRGEIRSTVLVLKLAELAYNEGQNRVKPALLLDDVFSELDSSRRHYLIQRLKGYQTVITTTDADAVAGEISDYHLIETRPAGRTNPKIRSQSKSRHPKLTPEPVEGPESTPSVAEGTTFRP